MICQNFLKDDRVLSKNDPLNVSLKNGFFWKAAGRTWQMISLKLFDS
jgi:hypothetical protein